MAAVVLAGVSEALAAAVQGAEDPADAGKMVAIVSVSEVIRLCYSVIPASEPGPRFFQAFLYLTF